MAVMLDRNWRLPKDGLMVLGRSRMERQERYKVRRTKRFRWRSAALGLAMWLGLSLWNFPTGLAPQEPRLTFLYPKSYRTESNQIESGEPIQFVFVQDAELVLVFAAVGYLVCYSQQCFVAAPHLDELAALRFPKPEVGALLAAGLYGANVAYNVLNKRLLNAYPNPVLITSVNLGTCSFCCLVAWALRWQGLPKVNAEKLTILLPLSVLNWLGILCANISISEVSIAFTHTVKAAEPLLTAFFTMVIVGGTPTLRSWLGLTSVIIGVAIASTTEMSFTWMGLYAAMASNVSVAMRTVVTKRFIHRKDVTHPLNVMAVVQCFSFVVSLPAAMFINPDSLHLISPKTLPCLLSIGPLVWIFNVASILILSRTSPVTHSMIRTLRRPVLVVASIIAFGSVMTPLNAFGILLALLGMFLFSGSPHRRDTRETTAWTVTSVT